LHYAVHARGSDPDIGFCGNAGQLQESDEKPEFFAEGIAHSSISMRSFRLG
jgi:hypothetical protein